MGCFRICLEQTAIIWDTLANAGYIPQMTDRSYHNQRTQASSWSHVMIISKPQRRTSNNKSVTYRSITNKADQWSPSYIITIRQMPVSSVWAIYLSIKIKTSLYRSRYHIAHGTPKAIHTPLEQEFNEILKKKNLQLWIDYLTVSNALRYKRLCLLQVEF